MHKHHIIPKHAGGTDDPSNLIILTIDEHAEAHKILWEQNGNQRDYIAWRALSKQIGREEIQRELGRLVGKSNIGKQSRLGKPLSDEAKRKISFFNKGKKLSESTKQKMSESRMGRIVTEETRKKISTANRGRILSNISRYNMSQAHIGIKRSKESIWKGVETRKKKNYRHSPETIEKMKQSAKNRQNK